MKNYVSICGLSLLLTGVGYSAAYSSNFDSLTPGEDLAGQDNWGITGASPTSGVSYVDTSNMPYGVPYLGTSGTYAGVLGVNDLDVGSSSAYLYQTCSIPLVGDGQTYSGTDFSVAMNIQDSNFQYPNRDTFGFTFKNGSGYNLFSIRFTPTEHPANPSINPPARVDNVTWSTGVTESAAFATQTEGNWTTIELNFTQIGVSNDVLFTVNSAGVPITTGTLTGLAGENIVNFGAFVKSYSSTNIMGNNALIFDDISLVPEPSSVLLGLLGVSLVFVRRRA